MITLRDGTIADVRRVHATPRTARSVLGRLWSRLVRRPRAFVLGAGSDATIRVDPALLAGRESFCLIDGHEFRPRLNLLPGMRGEVTVGAAMLSADQLLRDPGLRRSGGDSSYALPNGAHARIRCGRITFLIRLVAPGTPAWSPG